MNNFEWNGIPTIYFGQGSMEEAFNKELKVVGKNILLAYGGGSIKRTGIYEQMIYLLKRLCKNVFELNGIMSNPRYEKVQEGARFVKENYIDYIIAVGGGSVFDCCKIISAQAKTEKDICTMEITEGKLPTEFVSLATAVTVSGTGAEMNVLNVNTATGKETGNAYKKMRCSWFIQNCYLQI